MNTRRQERTHLIYHLRVFNARKGALLGQLVDITPEGVMIIGEKPVRVDRKYALRMDLPRNVMADRTLRFSAESKWCAADKSGDFYSMGFRIVEITPEGLEVVQKLAREFFQEQGESDPELDMNPVDAL